MMAGEEGEEGEERALAQREVPRIMVMMVVVAAAEVARAVAAAVRVLVGTKRAG